MVPFRLKLTHSCVDLFKTCHNLMGVIVLGTLGPNGLTDGSFTHHAPVLWNVFHQPVVHSSHANQFDSAPPLLALSTFQVHFKRATQLFPQSVSHIHVTSLALSNELPDFYSTFICVVSTAIISFHLLYGLLKYPVSCPITCAQLSLYL